MKAKKMLKSKRDFSEQILESRLISFLIFMLVKH